MRDDGISILMEERVPDELDIIIEKLIIDERLPYFEDIPYSFIIKTKKGDLVLDYGKRRGIYTPMIYIKDDDIEEETDATYMPIHSDRGIGVIKYDYDDAQKRGEGRYIIESHYGKRITYNTIKDIELLKNKIAKKDYDKLIKKINNENGDLSKVKFWTYFPGEFKVEFPSNRVIYTRLARLQFNHSALNILYDHLEESGYYNNIDYYLKLRYNYEQHGKENAKKYIARFFEHVATNKLGLDATQYTRIEPENISDNSKFEFFVRPNVEYIKIKSREHITLQGQTVIIFQEEDSIPGVVVPDESVLPDDFKSSVNLLVDRMLPIMEYFKDNNISLKDDGKARYLKLAIRFKDEGDEYTYAGDLNKEHIYLQFEYMSKDSPYEDYKAVVNGELVDLFKIQVSGLEFRMFNHVKDIGRGEDKRILYNPDPYLNNKFYIPKQHSRKETTASERKRNTAKKTEETGQEYQKFAQRRNTTSKNILVENPKESDQLIYTEWKFNEYMYNKIVDAIKNQNGFLYFHTGNNSLEANVMLNDPRWLTNEENPKIKKQERNRTHDILQVILNTPIIDYTKPFIFAGDEIQAPDGMGEEVIANLLYQSKETPLIRNISLDMRTILSPEPIYEKARINFGMGILKKDEDLEAIKKKLKKKYQNAMGYYNRNLSNDKSTHGKVEAAFGRLGRIDAMQRNEMFYHLTTLLSAPLHPAFIAKLKQST